MQYIIILLLVILSLYFLTTYFNKRETDLRHQLIALKTHNSVLKKELSKYSCKRIPKIKFSTPDKQLGLLNENSKIYLCPIEDSILIYSTKEKMQVNLLDECYFDDLTWYYVNLTTINNINCRGWVKKNNFCMLCNDMKNIPDNL